MSEQEQAAKAAPTKGFLGTVERVGNALPDPAVLFIALLGIVWVLSWLLSYIEFDVFHPATGERIVVVNQLAGDNFVQFMATMVNRFMTFGPIGVVLVAMLGIGVADHSGFITTAIRAILNVTPEKLLTPMVIFVGIISHSAVDAGYVLVIPLGGVIFYSAGRHPLAGIGAAFAGVSGGFSANPFPSSLDPLLQELTEQGARILDPNIQVNVLNNYYFTAASCVLIIGLGWYLTDKVVEPRLMGTPVDGDEEDLPQLHPIEPNERRGLFWAVLSMVIGLLILALTLWPSDSPWRDSTSGELLSFGAPIMQSIVSLIFFLFLIPGIVYGRVAGTMRGMKGVIEGMTKSMGDMAYYLVIMFFIAQFVVAFGQSQLGTLLAMSGANGLKALELPTSITIIGIVLLIGFVNLFVGSASSKWGLLAPVFVPMLMALGVGPDLTQAAYRVGDSSTNIITPLMPYFPLVVIYCQRYVKNTGIGTLAAMMLPYSMTFIVVWTMFLLAFFWLGIPLGVLSSYDYTVPQ